MNVLLRVVMFITIMAFLIFIPSAAISIIEGTVNNVLALAWFTFIGGIAIFFSLLMLGLILDIDMH